MVPLSALTALEPIDTGDLLTIIGFVATLIGLFFAYRQLIAGQRTSDATRKATQVQLLLQLGDQFRHFDDIHRCLMEAIDTGTPWNPPASQRTRVVQYMGLFERCKLLIDFDVLDISIFERQYGYRLRSIVETPAIKEKYLDDVDEARGWTDFINLWRDLDTQYETRIGNPPETQAPPDNLG
jgi:hypothetical protein